MHKKKMVSCLSAALLLLAQAPAYSAGLGKLSVNSALGQPLNAEIEVLTADPTELASLQARMATAEAYRSANLDMTGALSGVKVVLDKKPGGRSVLKVTSNKPITDPFIDMLIELSWGSGQMVREYTLLLDPPNMQAPAQDNRTLTVAPAVSAVVGSVPVANTAVVADTVKASKPVTSKPVVKPVAKAVPASKVVTPTPPSAPVVTPDTATSDVNVVDAPATVTIKRGATLSSVAKAVMPTGVKLDQMLVGLYRQNPQAFAGNMNQMKAGKVLKVPSKAEVAAISEAEAVREIKLQANDWHSYRQKLAGEVAEKPATDAKTAPNSGKITPKVEDKAAPVKAGQDVLKLSKGEAPVAGSKSNAVKPTAAQQKQAAQDEAVAKQKALQEANDRAAALEKNIKDMQRLVELKNQNLAKLQKEAAKPVPVPPAKPELVLTPVVKPVAVVPVKPEVKQEVKPEVKPEVVPVPKKVVIKPITPAPVVEPAWYENINPLYLGGGAVAGLLLALFGFMSKSRGRRAGLSKFENSIMTNVEAKPNTVYGTQGGAVVNTNNTSFLTDFSQSGLGNLDTHDVDPIAEAEVYMAYGRDAQAEEILKEAMVKDPARHEIKLKLLEIYAGRKNLPAFESIATELYSALAGEHSPVWEKAAELGRGLDPHNPLYGGSNVANTTPVVAALATPVLDVSADTELAMSSALDVASDSLAIEDVMPPVADVTHDTFDIADFTLPDMHAEHSLDFEVPTAVHAISTTDNAPEIVITDDNTLSFDFSLADELTEVVVPEVEVPALEFAKLETVEPVVDVDMPAMSLDFSGIDFDFDKPEEVEPEPALAIEPTLAPIDVALTEATVESVVAITPVVEVEHVESELSEAEQEVKTKLDLAQVYLEMGDAENAREILQEVIQEGNVEQQAHAHVLMKQVG
ncbi:MAG: hypothetical protein HOP20_07900 [Sulfuriferula sp.]|nr:hypothetical protein [Sulfuriferula sp.]